MNLQDLLGGTMFAQNGGSGSLMANLLGGQSRPYGVQGLMQQASDPGAMATQPMPQQAPPMPQQPPQGVQAMMPQPNAAQPATPAAPVHHGIDWRRIVGAISDGLSVAGGHDPLYYNAQQQDAKERAAYSQVLAKALSERQNEQWKINNPGPTEFARSAVESGLTPGTPEFQSYVKGAQFKPTFVGNFDGTGQGGFVSPPVPGGGSGAAAIPPEAIDILRKNPGSAATFEKHFGLPPGSAAQYVGGPTSPASATFR
jgi:hypothetical protein